MKKHFLTLSVLCMSTTSFSMLRTKQLTNMVLKSQHTTPATTPINMHNVSQIMNTAPSNKALRAKYLEELSNLKEINDRQIQKLSCDFFVRDINRMTVLTMIGASLSVESFNPVLIACPAGIGLGILNHIIRRIIAKTTKEKMVKIQNELNNID